MSLSWKPISVEPQFPPTIKLLTDFLLAKLTENMSPPMGQTKAVDGHIVNRQPGQSEGTASSCVPGVRVKWETHNEEANHSEGDWNSQGHLLDGNLVRNLFSLQREIFTSQEKQSVNLERPWVMREPESMDKHAQGCQGDEEPAREGGKVDELVDFTSD